MKKSTFSGATDSVCALASGRWFGLDATAGTSCQNDPILRSPQIKSTGQRHEARKVAGLDSAGLVQI